MGVGKCVSKENPKSDLDLDLGFVNIYSVPSTHDLELKFSFIGRSVDLSRL